MAEFELQEKIEAFLLEKMPPAERADFEARLLVDADLAEKVDDFRLVFRATDRLAQLNLQQDFKKWKSEIDQNEAFENSKTAEKRPIWAGFLIFLTVVGLVFLVWFFGKKTEIAPEISKPNLENPTNQKTDESKTEKIETENSPQNHVEKTPVRKNLPQAKAEKTDGKLIALARKEQSLLLSEIVTRGSGGNLMGEKTAISAAREALKNGRAGEVLKILEKFSEGDADFLEVLLLRGAAFFELENYGMAAENFEKCLVLKPENDLAEYQLLLCYLAGGAGFEQKLAALFEKIKSDPEHVYRANAEILREKI